MKLVRNLFLGVLLAFGFAHAGLVSINGSVLTVDGGGDSTITADLQASRTSCTAPCAVNFDATGTTSSDGTVDPFGEIGYSFDFGGVSGTWTHSGQSKDVQRGGPLAAIVFEDAGTYTVKVRARDSSGGSNDGDTSQDEVTVTVAAADTTYATTTTICLSRNTDFTGCPSGATQTPNAAAWPSWTSSRRYLLHAGQDFTVLGAIEIRQRVDIQVGAFGSGADPIVSSVSVETGNPNSTGTTWAERLTFADLDVTGRLQSGNSHLDVLVLRCTIGDGIELGGTIGFYYENPGAGGAAIQNALKRLRNTFIVESDVSGGEIMAVTAWGRGVALLGNTMHDPSVEHVLRVWQAYKSVFTHNHFSGAHSGRHHFKMHSSGAEDWDDDVVDAEQPATNYVVIADNIVGTGDNDFPFAAGPQNETVSEPPDEGVERVLYERNTFEVDYPTEIHMGGRLMYERANTVDGGSLGYTDNYYQPKIPDGWGESYSHSASAITTVDPT